MGLIIGVIIWAVIWGFATQAVIENKGYSENWFWWGFFFGIIAFIVSLTKPDCRVASSGNSNYSYIDTMNFLQEKKSEASKQADGSWLCRKCGNYNSSYVGTCACGMTKSKNAERVRSVVNNQSSKDNKQEQSHKQDNAMTESEKVDALLKYKNLLDIGAITEDEYNKKKGELLGKGAVTLESEVSTEDNIEKIANTDYSQVERMILGVLEKNPDGITSKSISQMMPRSILPKDIMEALKHLEDINVVYKDENGIIIKK